METIRGIVAILFTFSVAIFVHELGHFLFAKLFRVRVDTFSIGFGRKIWKRQWGETEYAIGILPFGGYVKLVGMHSKEMEEYLAEDDEKAEASDKPTEPVSTGVTDTAGVIPPRETLSESVVEEMSALRSKPWPAKFLIFSAGCINNFLTAVLVYFMLAWVGHYRAAAPPALIDRLSDMPPGMEVPLHGGDKVLAINGMPVSDYGDMLNKFEDAGTTSPLIAMTVERDGAKVALELPSHLDSALTAQPGSKIVKIGDTDVVDRKDLYRAVGKLLDDDTTSVAVTVSDNAGKLTTREAAPIATLGPMWLSAAAEPHLIPYVALPLPNLPADKAGMMMYDTVTAVDGKPVQTVGVATELIRAAAGRTIPITVKRTDKISGEHEVTLDVPVRDDPESPGRGQIGVSWGTPPTELYKLSAVPAAKAAVRKASRLVVRYLDAVGNLLFRSSFQTIRESLGGPIAIAQQTYSAAQKGPVWFFELFALFNIILAVTNLLPLPVLDGGHILFATIESVIRRPLPPRVMVRVYNVFIFLLIGLALLVTFNDVVMNAWRIF
ncbi:hypothetical protein CVU37_06060 [candidate division BRC1 bacterium HGW-BRC1-1]|jgi:regulator of sigma E protease|nr:MAG: hypothetical protein CVU37_06060 [candidate division BRC1 bacterium HGW-BRC1-1]